MSQAFKFEKADQDVGFLIFDTPDARVNKFNTPVMLELDRWIDKLEQMTDLKCLVFMSGKKDSYIVGADVHEIIDITDTEKGYEAARKGQVVFDRFSRLPFPTIAAINGACMGGGTELSLACDYRLATTNPKTRIGLPEVTLGILPGWGGTQRLMRLIGLQRTLDVVLSGRQLNTKRAWRTGIVDRMIPAEWLREKALEFAGEIMAGKGARYTSRRKPKGLLPLVLEKNPLGRKLLFSQARKTVLKKTGGNYPAPLKALEVIRKTRGKSLKKGLETEAKALAELIVTPECKSLVQIFLWTDEIKKENGTSRPDLKGGDIRKGGVLGAGVMGGGIAQLFASKGIPVRVKDIHYDAVAKAYQQAAGVLKGQLKRRRIKKEEYRQILLRISGGTDYRGLKQADLIVEAIVEDLEIKKKVLAELETHTGPDTIIASNTSSLRIDDMGEALKTRKRFIGMHFFNPVHRMPLVEIIRGPETSDEAVATVYNLTLKLGKTPIVVNDGPGFLVNRILVPYMVEAVSLLEEGNSVPRIDKAMRNFGMPMGPFELFDEVGIDVAQKVAVILQKTMAGRMAESDLLSKMIDNGRLGKKTAKGFYRHNGKKREFDAFINTLVTSREGDVLDDATLIQRMVYPMINEATRCIEEGIVTNPRDVDIGMIFGTGFAPFRGGLLKYADAEGSGKIVDTLDTFSDHFGSRFNPAQTLRNMAHENRTFH